MIILKIVLRLLFTKQKEPFRREEHVASVAVSGYVPAASATKLESGPHIACVNFRQSSLSDPAGARLKLNLFSYLENTSFLSK